MVLSNIDIQYNKTNNTWAFASEKDLEEFIKINLFPLKQLTVIAQQYRIGGDICDLIATNTKKQLFILELKNKEDRHIIDQLTRYYDNLELEKPAKLDVDWNKPIKLIAILPKVSRQNIVSLKHSRLNFEIYTFTIQEKHEKLFFSMINYESKEEKIIEIPSEQITKITNYEELDQSFSIRPVPKKLMNLILEIPEYETVIIQIREKILGFHKNMGEKCNVVSKYGLINSKNILAKTKLCAEIYAHKFNGNFGQLKLFLILPYAKQKRSYFRERRDINPADRNNVRFCIILKPSDINQEVTELNIYRNFSLLARASHSIIIEEYWLIYNRVTNLKPKDNTLESLIEVALDCWLDRVHGQLQSNN